MTARIQNTSHLKEPVMGKGNNSQKNDKKNKKPKKDAKKPAGKTAGK
jgi:hypothetical protein